MDPMIWISFVSGVAFAFLGNWMARRRGANSIIWTGLGFLFPPTLLVLKLMQWEAKPRDSASEDVEEELNIE